MLPGSKLSKFNQARAIHFNVNPLLKRNFLIKSRFTILGIVLKERLEELEKEQRGSEAVYNRDR